MPRWTIDVLAPVDEPAEHGESDIWGLASSLVDRGHRVRVLYPSATLEPVPSHGPVTGVPVPLIGQGRRPFSGHIAAGRNASDLVDRAADLLLGNDVSAGALDAHLTLPQGRPVFGLMVHAVAVHDRTARPAPGANGGIRGRIGQYLDRRTLRGLERRALERARLVIVDSDRERELLARYYALPRDRVRLLPPGVPEPLDVGSRADARMGLHIPGDVPVVACAGRFPEAEGLATATGAFRRIRGFFPGARLVVLGSSPPTEPGIVPLGPVDAAAQARALRAADVFLFPARQEGFRRLPRLAMRHGLATIVSDRVPLDGIPSPKAIRVVQGEDPADYASELAELLADPATTRTLGQEGKAAADGFSYARMAGRFEEMFQPILGGGA